MADASRKLPWAADIYARDYIPQALLAVNDSPATVVPPSASLEIDYSAYISTYAGTSFLKQLPEVGWAQLRGPINYRSNTELSPEVYGQFFEECMLLETEAQRNEMARHALFGVKLTFTPRELPLYSLEVPGLRDGAPSITIGQTVLLRQLILDGRTKLPQGMDMWLQPGGGLSQGLPAPGFTGMEIHATVYAIDRTREIIILTAHGLIHHFPLTCNIGFTVSPKTMVGMHRAANLTAKELLVSPNSWVHRMLFPEKRNGLLRSKLPSATFDISWFDSSLNHEQKKAVHATLKRNYGEFPFLLYGPPGSGKTKTVCELVLQLADDSEFKGSVLLCAPSHPAADTLANRLLTSLGPAEMLRLNDCSRTFAEVPNSLLPYCFVKDDMFSLPSPADVLKKKVVVCTCRDADMLVQARLTNRDIASLQRDVTKMTYPFHESPNTLPCHWLALIIDEAAQATEPETLVPITVVNPHPECNSGATPLFAMVGDEHQLNPRVFDPSTALKVSLFERLAKGSPYASHPLARGNTQDKQGERPMIHPPFVNLSRNYRSHPAILALPSALFYNNTLIPEATDVSSLLPWSQWKACRWPVLFSCNGGIDESEFLHNRGTGWHNRREVEKALTYAEDLLNCEVDLSQSEICIMSPFQAQVRRLRKRARERSLPALNIGPMEAFQGLESRVVIICTTRARKRFLHDDEAKGLGIIGKEKKLNVAITRAKEGLVVIGNPWTMATNYHWDQFLRFCYRNGLWESETDLEDDVGVSNQQEKSTHEWKPSESDGARAYDSGDLITSLERALTLTEREERNRNHDKKRMLGGYDIEASLWQNGIDAQQSLDTDNWPRLP